MPDKLPTSTLQREVSATPEEFRRGLLLAFPGRVKENGNIFKVDTGSATMEISLSVGSPRAIANLHLPTLYVTLRFTAGSIEAQQEILTQMDRAMHRGGG